MEEKTFFNKAVQIRRELIIPSFLSGIFYGPLLSYFSALFRFGLGFESSMSLTTYVLLTLFSGFFIGIIASFICIIYKCRYCECVIVCFLLMASSQGLDVYSAFKQGAVLSIGWPAFIIPVIVNTFFAGFLGYVIAFTVKYWIKRQKKTA